MSDLLRFDMERARAREARSEARLLRELVKIAKCGLDMKYGQVALGTYTVPRHIQFRMADQYQLWADEYTAIADEIEAGLERMIADRKTSTDA